MRVTTLLILLFPCLIFAADPSEGLDSLERVLTDAATEDNVVLALKLTKGYLRKDPDKALEYGRTALEMAHKINNPARTAQAFDFLGRAHDQKGNYILATDCFERGIQLARKENNIKLVAHLNNSLGVVFSKKGEHKNALTYFIEAKNHWEILKDYRQVAIILNNIGALHIRLKNYDAAVSAINEALEANSEDDKMGDRIRAQSYNNLGSVFEEIQKYDQALEYYLKALEMKREEKQETAAISTLASIVSVYSHQKDEMNAARYYEEALRIAEGSQDTYWLHNLYRINGERLQQSGKLREAIEYYLKSLELATRLDSKNTILELRQLLSRTYADLGDHEAALMHQLLYNDLKDSLINEKNARQLADLQSLYQFEEQQKKIAELRSREQLNKIRQYGLAGLSVLLIIALIGFYSRYRIKQKTNQLLADQNREIQEQNHLLEEQNREIEAKNLLLEQQTKAINVQNVQLQRTNEDLEQFAYAASHDLREPLRTIRSYMQLLDMRYKEKLDNSARDFINYATIGAVRMDELLQELLEYSRIGRMESQKTKVNLETLIFAVEESLTQQIKENNARVIHFDLPMVYGFRSELSLLFQNLISNAIKFRRKDVNPEVHIYAREEKDHVVISVSDNGIGIEDHYKDQVFSLFKRLHTREEYDGSGLGLAICKKIIENHEGQIWLNSEPGVGTTFFVKLPLLPDNE